MSTDDREFAKKITACLDRGTAGVKAGTAYKLQQARAQALARLAERESVTGLTLAGAHGLAGGNGLSSRSGKNRHSFWASRGLWIGIALIVAGGVFYPHWQATQAAKDIEETDAAILASELPIDAYLDRGFQNWLKFGSE